jgi:molybdate transport system regulatory protein
MKYSVKGRIWIETEKGAYFGSGRITLLERIKEFGSITVAAKSMKMSYRQAWEQVESMNKQVEKPLVIKNSGGLGGGGTQLTKEGERVIALYNNVSEQFLEFAKSSQVKVK